MPYLLRRDTLFNVGSKDSILARRWGIRTDLIRLEKRDRLQVGIIMADVWRIFVVEHDEVLNQSLVNTLTRDGYAVQSVRTGLDAVRILWSEAYNVVICDLTIPGADSFELLQWLRAFRPDTHMIMIAGSDPSARLRALESGAASFLEKPVDFHFLREELRRLSGQTGFSASLDSFDLLDVIQIITMSHKSIALLINTGLEERGILHFRDGDLVWAEYGVLRGEEAFFALAAHKNGTVTHQPWNEQGATNVTRPLSRLIFQALQYRTKYADRQQYSGEMEPVKTSSAFSEEIDDSPFVILQEDSSVQSMNMESVGMERENDILPDFQTARVNADVEPARPQKEWWQNTAQVPRVRAEEIDYSHLDEDDIQSAPTMAIDGSALDALLKGIASPQTNPLTPLQAPDTRGDLPEWLTDLPTTYSSAMPSLSIPEPLPVPEPTDDIIELPKVPATPAVDASSDMWPASGFDQFTILDPVLQDIVSSTPEVQKPVPEMETMFMSPPDWNAQGALPPLMQDEPIQVSPAIDPPQMDFDMRRDNDTFQEGNLRATATTLQAQRMAKLNYAALASALQSLGYAIPGFIAAAVATFSGQPVAQVAVDESDVSSLCRYLSVVQKNIVAASDEDDWGVYESLVISSRKRHVMIHNVGTDKKMFLLVMATREANPVECQEMMANVEAAISAALN